MSGDRPDRPTTPDEIEVTPAMIAAGVDVLWEQKGLVGPYAAEEVAGDVFRAMRRAWHHGLAENKKGDH
jgi:hypothetical protein